MVIPGRSYRGEEMVNPHHQEMACTYMNRINLKYSKWKGKKNETRKTRV